MRIPAILLALCCTAGAQTTITVGNAASGASGVVPGSLARISIVQAGGSGLVPIDVSTVSVQIEPSSGPPLTAPILGASSVQVVILVPKELPLGTAKVTLTSKGQASIPALVAVVASNVGIFTQGGNGLGPALAPPYKLTKPALPGQYVTLWTTGLGASGPVTVTLGGHPTVVSYAGAAPGFPGLDQINFQVPVDSAIPDGCYVAVSVQAGTSTSYTASIPKSTVAGACRSSFGFTEDTLTKLDAGQRITLPLFVRRFKLLTWMKLLSFGAIPIGWSSGIPRGSINPNWKGATDALPSSTNCHAPGYSLDFTATARLTFNGSPFFSATSVTCRVRSSDGQLVLPTALLSFLPSGNPQYQLTVSIAPRPDKIPQFTIPLKDGTKLPAIVQYLSSESIPVAIQ